MDFFFDFFESITSAFSFCDWSGSCSVNKVRAGLILCVVLLSIGVLICEDKPIIIIYFTLLAIAIIGYFVRQIIRANGKAKKRRYTSEDILHGRYKRKI